MSSQPARAPAPSQKKFRWGGWLFALLWSALVAGGYGVYTGASAVPERFNPGRRWT